MNDDYAQTLVMDNNSNAANKKPSAADVAEKIQVTIEKRNEPAAEETFTQTYSYLT